MAGGAGEDFEASKAVMRHLCANFTHMGPSGAGQTTKLINQVLCALHFMAVAEATRLALDAGVDATRIPEALGGGRADSTILQEFMVKFATRDYTPTGRIDNMVKDLNGVQDLARKTGTAMPLTAACAEIHRLLDSAGLGGADNAALMKYFDGPDTGGRPGMRIRRCAPGHEAGYASDAAGGPRRRSSDASRKPRPARWTSLSLPPVIRHLAGVPRHSRGADRFVKPRCEIR